MDLGTPAKINAKQAKGLFAELAAPGVSASSGSAQLVVKPGVAPTIDIDAMIAERGLEQISDASALDAAIDKILAANPSQLADYRAGKEKLFGYFVGQVPLSPGPCQSGDFCTNYTCQENPNTCVASSRTCAPPKI